EGADAWGAVAEVCRGKATTAGATHQRLQPVDRSQQRLAQTASAVDGGVDVLGRRHLRRRGSPPLSGHQALDPAAKRGRSLRVEDLESPWDPNRDLGVSDLEPVVPVWAAAFLLWSPNVGLPAVVRHWSKVPP